MRKGSRLAQQMKILQICAAGKKKIKECRRPVCRDRKQTSSYQENLRSTSEIRISMAGLTADFRFLQ